MFNLRKKCKLCIDVQKKLLEKAAFENLSDESDEDSDDENNEDTKKVKGEKSSHCHCPLFEVKNS